MLVKVAVTLNKIDVWTWDTIRYGVLYLVVTLKYLFVVVEFDR